MERIVVIGTSCSGKTTMAYRLAQILGFTHIELDQLHWLPDWEMRPLSEFRALVEGAVSGERWVLDGNYSKVRDVVWPRATHLVWLNYSFTIVFGRALRRTFHRVVGQEELFAGNRETLRNTLFDRESILWWVIRTYRRRRREYPQLFKLEQNAHLRVIEIQAPEEAESFLRRLQHQFTRT
jgi:adenylate kinase family enzyme